MDLETIVTFSSEDSDGNIINITQVHEDIEDTWMDGSIHSLCQQFKLFLLAKGFTESSIQRELEEFADLMREE